MNRSVREVKVKWILRCIRTDLSTLHFEMTLCYQDEVTEEQRRQADDERRQQLQVQGDTIEADLSLLHDREERIVQLEVSVTVHS